MGKQLPDLWEGCYDGEHRKLLAPEQFKQMFCNVCLNPGCRNSRGAGSKWNQRMLTQEDRLLNNPAFAPDMTAEIMGLPDFQNMIQDALRIEISTRRGDWEPVTDADVGRAAAEMMGVVPEMKPEGFLSDPTSDPTQQRPPEEAEPPPTQLPAACGQEEPSVDTPLTNEPVEGRWRVRGDSLDEKGKPRTYTVTHHGEDEWSCDCPSRESPCKHTRYIQARLKPEPSAPAPNPTRPEPVRDRKPPRPPRPSFNTGVPQGGIVVGGPTPNPAPEPVDPWAVKPSENVVKVGGRVTFGSRTKKKP